MRLETITNIIRNAANGAMLPEMVRKVRTRLTESESANEMEAWRNELAAKSIKADQWASRIDASLWQESTAFAEEQKRHADHVLANIPVIMGGGGFYALLYFLTRYLKPEAIVETGVAAGFSSRAFLKAIAANGSGHLYSSDFPYFRIRNPEKYIGILVEKDLAANWTLNIGGDRVALPAFAEAVSKIDLIHYDSDKSVGGRNFALDTIGPRLAPDAVIVFDDIQDNLHFRDYAAKAPGATLLFSFGGKYIGLKTTRPDLAASV